MDDIHDVTSPVVAFRTVRLFLIMSLHLNWYTCSVNLANAFIQADRLDNLFMQFPHGFTATHPNLVSNSSKISMVHAMDLHFGLSFSSQH